MYVAGIGSLPIQLYKQIVLVNKKERQLLCTRKKTYPEKDHPYSALLPARIHQNIPHPQTFANRERKKETWNPEINPKKEHPNNNFHLTKGNQERETETWHENRWLRSFFFMTGYVVAGLACHLSGTSHSYSEAKWQFPRHKQRAQSPAQSKSHRAWSDVSFFVGGRAMIHFKPVEQKSANQSNKEWNMARMMMV